MPNLSHRRSERKQHRHLAWPDLLCWGCCRWFNPTEAIPFPGRNSRNLRYCLMCIETIIASDKELQG